MARLTSPTPGRSAPAGAAAEIEHASRVFVAITSRVLDELDTSISQAGLRALLVLDDHGGCTLGELAHRVPLSQSATSRMVDRLVLSGLVQRSPRPGDRRQLQVSMTPAGRALVTRLTERRRALIEEIVADLTTADRAELLRGLAAFDAAALRGESAG
jgi:DNA-binding MarR family transcriptional regulator